ncbi:DNA repair protein [Candidatus Nitrosoglobus terrae]|uniref:DNA repair protein n=1 Tax=Candidatus Nitrosoglobus terrae TaxID=1630141 RepID=A0A1Q2SMJ4_9GAMM|nr:PD-(D/E)XK nuclease family protein [Candidatus Nitrosoglobus terrae]BAW80350.1 DNA repair protein [Candidatus Nitrosoglobus terrae]
MRVISSFPLINQANTFSALEFGALLLTVNNRLSREFHQYYDLAQQAKGLTVWETPQIFPWQVWLQRYYHQVLTLTHPDDNPSTLLNFPQEQSLWEQIIYESPYRDTLLQVPATANTAQEAWKLWHAWRLPLTHQSSLIAEDTQVFLKWAQVFKAYCQKNNWLDNARLPDEVARISISTRKKIPIPRTIILAGFDEYTPQQQEFFTLLTQQKTEIRLFSAKREIKQAVRIALSDTAKEITIAARWAKQRLETNLAERIGVVIPDLELLRDKVVQIFDGIFHPEAILPGYYTPERAYNISLGQPLVHYPLIYTALLILDFTGGTLSLTKIGALLRSPFLGEAEQEYYSRGILDAYLRKYRESTVALDRLLAAAMVEEARYYCPALSYRLQQFKAALEQLPIKQPPSSWAQRFTHWLYLLGWPGERSLNSEEYQVVLAWHKAVQSFASLDQILPSLKRNTALNKLRRILVGTLFQPESAAEVPIQIMGVLEANDANFDAIWILGLHDEVWPSPPSPNPLLPIELQRHYGLPHASAERELAFARTITKRLLTSAPTIVISHPCRKKDSDLRPSPLIMHLEPILLETLNIALVHPYAAQIQLTSNVEAIVDNYGPSLETRIPIKGGTALLKDQAACPFRAFAKHRLEAKGLEEPSTGLAALDQGSLVHDALRFLWEQLKDQHTLVTCSEKDLQNRVAKAASKAIDVQTKSRPQTFTAKFKAIEQERLEKLLLEWLIQDKQRSTFKVLHLEKSQPLTIGGIHLTIRADRIDQLENGHQVIIDYKTGKLSLRQWEGDRPEEPQLPLYYVAHQAGAIDAILFAQVRRGEMKYLGIAKEQGLAPNTAAKSLAHWDQQVVQWQQILNKLATEVAQGYAAVIPRDSKSCNSCPLPSLCRVGEIEEDVSKDRDDHEAS